MKKVLIIGPRFYGYNFSIANAFKNLGYSSSVIEYLPGEVSSLKEKLVYHTYRNKELFFEKQEENLMRVCWQYITNLSPTWYL